MRKLLRRCHPLREQQGISLLETLLVVGVLGFIAVAFLSALATGSRATGTLDEHVQAESLARSQLEQIKNALYDPVNPTSPTDPSNYLAVDNTPANYSVSYAVTYPEYPSSNWQRLQKITVTVYHQGDAMLQMTDFKMDRQ